VAAAKPVPSSPSEPKNTWAFDLQKQVQELTKVVSELRLQPKASQNHTPQSQQNTTRRKFRPQRRASFPGTYPVFPGGVCPVSPGVRLFTELN
jgi:hypothetical protein